MNRSGQFAWITFLVFAGVAFIFWALFLGGFIATQAHTGGVASGATGFELFMLDNLNIVIFGGFLLSIFAVIYFGGAAR